MSESMIGYIMLIGRNDRKHVFLIPEMLIEDLEGMIPCSLVGSIILHSPNSIEEANMFVIQLFDVHQERFVPNKGVRYCIVSAEEQLTAVSMVSVLDMGGQPFLSKGNNLDIRK